MNRFCLLLFAISFWTASAVTAQQVVPQRVGVGVIQRKMTLKQAIELAITSNLEVEIERTNVGTASAAARAARGFYDPTFRWQPLLESRTTPAGSVLQGANGKLTEHLHSQNFYFRQRLPFAGSSLNLDFENARQSSTNPFLALNPYITSRLQLSFTQPLMRGRTIDPQRTELKIRRKQVDLSETDFEVKVIDVVTRVEQAYWDLVAARQSAVVKADTVDWARQQLERNKRMIDAGTLAPVELSASEAELERRLDDWYASVGLITTAENALKTMIAANREDPIWNDEIVPTEESTLPPPEADNIQEAVARAVRLRPEARRVSQLQEVNQAQKEQNADLTKPQVNLVAGYANNGLGGSAVPGDNPFTASNALLYSRVNQLSAQAGLPAIPRPDFGSVPGGLIGGYGTTLSNLFGGSYPTVQVGLAIDFTFRNTTAEANLAQSVIAERRLKLQQAQVEQLIAAEVRNALQAIQTARQRIAAAEASVRAAGEKVESETRLFQTGESTNFLVLTRQNEYADSRHRLLVAKLDFNKAIARLKQALGTTLEAHSIKLK